MSLLTGSVVKKRIAFIGPHGAGKSTLGKKYTLDGYTHINIGFLARMSRRKILPKDIPLRVMFELRKHKPGTILGDSIIVELMKWINSLDLVVVDGFPSHPRHLGLIPDPQNWEVGYVYCPKAIRESRLKERSLATNRKWTPGLTSERDLSLVSLIREIKDSKKITFRVMKN